MKYPLILLVLFIFSNSTPTYADNYIPYLNLTNKAEWLYDQGKFTEAKTTFEEAFELVEKIKHKDVLVYCKILSQENKQEEVYSFLKSYLIKTSGYLLPISSDLERLEITLSEKRLNDLDKNVDTTSVRYQAEVELSNELEKLVDLDLLVRIKNREKDSIWWVSGKDSNYVSRYQQMLVIDSLNYVKLLELMPKFLPKVENLIMSEFSLSKLLIHMNYDRFVSIEDQLFELVKKGMLDPWVFARSKDRAYATQIDCPIYFTYPYGFDKTFCVSLKEIEEKRKSIGLSPYYRRPSFSYYLRPGRMMKEPFYDFYMMVIEEEKD